MELTRVEILKGNKEEAWGGTTSMISLMMILHATNYHFLISGNSLQQRKKDIQMFSDLILLNVPYMYACIKRVMCFGYICKIITSLG